MDYFVKALQEHPELAIFLALAMGFLDRADQNRIVQSRDRCGHAAGGRAHRAARHQGSRGREEHLLRPLPLHHRVQGRPPVLPGVEKGRPAATGGDGRFMRHVPALLPSSPRKSWGMTWGRRRVCWPGPLRNPRSSARPAMPSTASASRPRRRPC